MFTAISVNAVHVLCSLWFAFGMDMGIVGIAYASVIAQWTGVGLSLLLLMLRYRKVLTGIDWAEVFDMKPLKTFFIVNATSCCVRSASWRSTPLHGAFAA